MKNHSKIRELIRRLRVWRNSALLPGPGISGTVDSRHYRDTMVSILEAEIRDALACR